MAEAIDVNNLLPEVKLEYKSDDDDGQSDNSKKTEKVSEEYEPETTVKEEKQSNNAEASCSEKTTDMEVSQGSSENKAETSTGTGESGSDVDVYAYLKRQEFTTEIFKIEIQNLPKIFGYSQLKKRLQSLELKPAKIKAFANTTYAFVTFKCEEDRAAAIKAVTGHKWKGRVLKAKIAGPAADPMLRKRKQEAQEGDGPAQKKKTAEDDRESDLSPAERVNNAVTPLWNVPYEEQLKSKHEEMREYLKRLGWEIGKGNPDDKDWLAEQRKKYEGIGCQFDDVIPSPVLRDYRNKCEFTIGKHVNGTDKAVGFRLGSYKTGSLRVVDVEECIHINQPMKDVAKMFESYLQTSPLTSFDPEEKVGHYRVLTVRTSATGALLVIADFHPQTLTQEEITAEKDRMNTYFSSGPGKDSGITSLYCAIHSDRVASPNDEVPLHHIIGEKAMEERLLDMKFRISPLAFFQVNTQAAELLYSRVKEWCKVTPQTTVLDVCCGTGTIGLSMAKDVDKVIGIELCLPAVENAKENAKLNGIENAEFHCGKAEHVLPPMIKRYSDKDVVAVVDPPRSGLHTDVVLAIRRSEFVKRLIYVSCNPKGAQLNMLTFTRAESRKAKGPPFRLIQAVPVDLFPHTKHCELVMLLER